MNTRTMHLFLSTLLAAVLPLSACTVDVRNEEAGERTEVDVRSPVGTVSVRTDIDARDTGLAVYPGAVPRRGGNNEPESANVSVGGPWFGVKVVAASFDSDDAPEKVLEFYRSEMKAHGDVVECRGDVDFRGDRLVCREDASSREVQLAAGTEERHRIVHVEPRGSGSEFALVYLQAGGKG